MNISHRTVHFFVAITTVIAIFIIGTQGAYAFSGSGSGTVGDPFQVNSCAQLQEINDDLDAHYLLTNNIDCAETATWNVNLDEWVDGDTDNSLIPDSYTGVVNNGYFGFNPIGRDDAANMSGPGFTGTFDGNGYTISNVWIFRNAQPNTGLFGYATGATIKNLTLDDARIVGQQNVGAFLGYGSGVTLDNLTNVDGMVRAYLSYRGGGIAGWLENSSLLDDAQVLGGNVHGSGNIIGGLVGYLSSSTVTDSETSAAIDGGEYIGGAFGEVNNSQIGGVHASGNVVSNSSEGWLFKSGNYTGGFVGRIDDSAVVDSSATGSVSAEGDYVGGFAGYIYQGTYQEVTASGAVSGNNTVGGFAGTLFAVDVTDASATGLVTNTGNAAGGFAGESLCGTEITRATAFGSVSSTGAMVGGFAGLDGCEGPGTVYNQVAAHGNVIGTQYVGGFVGQSYVSQMTDVYAAGNVTGTQEVGGFGGYVYQTKIDNAYSRGTINASTETNVGGFIGIYYVGVEDQVITDSFWNGTTAAPLVSACGDGACENAFPQTTAAMKTIETFTDLGWDFDTIWDIGSDNDGYPYFGFETFSEEPDDTTAPVLTLITPIASTTTIANAVLTFSTNEACDVLAEAPVSNMGPVELLIDSTQSVGVSRRAYLNGIQVGGTYSFRFECQDEAFNSSNTISSGAFIVIADTVGSSGQGTPWKPVTVNGGTNGNGGASNSGSSNATTPATCPADQILTQNMRAGARDGRFHPYTRGIVKEVKILQGHMNRLGFNSGKIDGILGRITDGAIKRMQTYLGTPADGLIGPKTRALINNSCGDKGLVR